MTIFFHVGKCLLYWSLQNHFGAADQKMKTYQTLCNNSWYDNYMPKFHIIYECHYLVKGSMSPPFIGKI